MKTLDTIWSEAFGQQPPVAYMLREACRERWVRFHSLPDGKRYATTPAEASEVLHRHEAVLEHLAGADGHVFLVTAAYSDSPFTAQRDARLLKCDPSAQLWRVLPMHVLDGVPGDPDPNFWHLYASERTWRRSAFDDVLRHVADDEIANVLLVFDRARFLYHPYDGGADVILSEPALRDRIQREFREWIPAREDGL